MSFLSQFANLFKTPSNQFQSLEREVKKTGSVASIVRKHRYRQRAYGAETSIAQWRVAVDNALLPPYFSRLDLMDIYERVVDDADVWSAIDTRIKKVLAEKFYLLGPDKTPDLDKTAFLEKTWFLDLIREIVMAEFYGVSLVELDAASRVNGEFTRITPIDRVHISPERGGLMPDPLNVAFIIPYREEPFSNWLLEFGQDNDLGTLKKVTYYYLRKAFAEKDWSRHSERFGKPFLTMKTASTDEKELNAYEDALLNFGANGYMILDDMDEIAMLESRQGSPQEMYKSQLDYYDSKIAKILSGQESTSSEKAWVGSAEVHERILETYNDADLRRVTAAINDKVLPFLVAKGYPLQGYSFKYEYFYELERYKAQKQAASQAQKEESEQTQALNLILQKLPFQTGCCH